MVGWRPYFSQHGGVCLIRCFLSFFTRLTLIAPHLTGGKHTWQEFHGEGHGVLEDGCVWVCWVGDERSCSSWHTLHRITFPPTSKSHPRGKPKASVEGGKRAREQTTGLFGSGWRPRRIKFVVSDLNAKKNGEASCNPLLLCHLPLTMNKQLGLPASPRLFISPAF